MSRQEDDKRPRPSLPDLTKAHIDGLFSQLSLYQRDAAIRAQLPDVSIDLDLEGTKAYIENYVQDPNHQSFLRFLVENFELRNRPAWPHGHAIPGLHFEALIAAEQNDFQPFAALGELPETEAKRILWIILARMDESGKVDFQPENFMLLRPRTANSKAYHGPLYNSFEAKSVTKVHYMSTLHSFYLSYPEWQSGRMIGPDGSDPYGGMGTSKMLLPLNQESLNIRKSPRRLVIWDNEQRAPREDLVYPTPQPK